MKKKIIVIGYGSIGKKHCRILRKLKQDYYVISSQKNIKEQTTTYEQFKIINPDYIIIATPTNEHLKNLKKVDSLVKGKIILVEKPLFDVNSNYSPKNNKVFVGYNLRFNPVIKYLKKINKKNKPINAEIFCGSYLPSWRSRNYINTSSSKKELGGGVLNDLSHEIDYANYIFGDLKKIFKFKSKISNLKINTDDFAILLCKKKKIKVLIVLDYISMIKKRIIKINYSKFSIEADLIKNVIHFQYLNKKSKKSFKLGDTYFEQINSLIKNKFETFCDINQARKVLNIIH